MFSQEAAACFQKLTSTGEERVPPSVASRMSHNPLKKPGMLTYRLRY